jgi:hypothetical protein
MLSYKKIISRTVLVSLFATQLLLTGCAALVDQSTKHELIAPDATKGVIVGTVFERSILAPRGAKFHIKGPNNDFFVLSSGGDNLRYNITSDQPKGVGMTFARQLAPGKYKVWLWALSYGRNSKFSGDDPGVEFEVEAGKVIYLGRFDANRFLEVASIHDNFKDDLKYLSRNPLIDVNAIENKALSKKGWWIFNSSGKELIKKTESKTCEQC